MSSPAQILPASQGIWWTSVVMSTLPSLLVLMGGVMKLVKAPGVAEGFARAGLPEHLILPVGLIELVCVIVYAIPRTAVLGAILMTGLLGGAALACIRVSDPTAPLPILCGILAWGGLYLRDRRVRALIPLRAPQNK